MQKLNACYIFSGGASTVWRLYLEAMYGVLKGKIYPVLMIATNGRAGGIQLLQDNGFPGGDMIILGKQHKKEPDRLSEIILEECRKRSVDFISLNGCTTKIPKEVISQFPGFIFNQHPVPLDFGGQYMYGLATHAAFLNFCEMVQEKREQPITNSAVIAHHVSINEKYDDGPIAGYLEVPLTKIKYDNPLALQKRAIAYEHMLHVNVELALATGNLPEKLDYSVVQPDEEEKRLSAMKMATYDHHDVNVNDPKELWGRKN